MEWLWQGLLANGLWRGVEIVMIAVIGAIMAFLKSRGKSWIDPTLYGLRASAFLAILIFFATALATLPSVQPEINGENAETRVRSWLDHFHLASTVMPNSPIASWYLLTRIGNRDVGTRPFSEYL